MNIPLVNLLKSVTQTFAEKTVPGASFYKEWKGQHDQLKTALLTIAKLFEWLIAAATIWEKKQQVSESGIGARVLQGRDTMATACWMLIQELIDTLKHPTSTISDKLKSVDQYYFAMGDALEEIEQLLITGNSLVQKCCYLDSLFVNAMMLPQTEALETWITTEVQKLRVATVGKMTRIPTIIEEDVIPLIQTINKEAGVVSRDIHAYWPLPMPFAVLQKSTESKQTPTMEITRPNQSFTSVVSSKIKSSGREPPYVRHVGKFFH